MREKQSLMYEGGDDGNTEDNTCSARSSQIGEFDSVTVRQEALEIFNNFKQMQSQINGPIT